MTDHAGLRAQLEDLANEYQQIAGLEHLSQVLRAAASALDPGWQPIETAPKDRSIVLGWFPYHATSAEGGSVFVMRWNDEHYCPKPRPYWDASGWVWGVRDQRRKQPTHWMPLPDPPLAGAREPER